MKEKNAESFKLYNERKEHSLKELEMKKELNLMKEKDRMENIDMVNKRNEFQKELLVQKILSKAIQIEKKKLL